MSFLLSFLLEIVQLAAQVAIELLKIVVMLVVAAVRLGGWLLVEVVFPGVRGLGGAVSAMIANAARRRGDDWRRR